MGLPFRVAGFSGKIIDVNTDKKRLRVGVLFGGRSGEHEVSLASAAAVIRGLDADKYEAVPIGITKEGHWLVGAGAQKMLPEVLKGGQRVMMTADPTDAALVRLDGSGGGQRLDVVFPVSRCSARIGKGSRKTFSAASRESSSIRCSSSRPRWDLRWA